MYLHSLSIERGVQAKYKYALAETENVRERGRRLKDEAKIFSIQSFSKDLLDVADVMDRAIESVPNEKLDTADMKALHDGVVMIRTVMLHIFKKHGITKVCSSVVIHECIHSQVTPDGHAFNPNIHEAIAEIPAADGGKSKHIAHVADAGYHLHERPIRAAKVVVYK